LNQTFYRYPSQPSDTQYRFTSHLDTQLTQWLTWNIEGGYFLRDAAGSRQDLAAARTGLNFAWGKLTLRTGYQYNYEVTEQTERRDRNFFYFYLKRIL
jgi:hypothetical protein